MQRPPADWTVFNFASAPLWPPSVWKDFCLIWVASTTRHSRRDRALLLTPQRRLVANAPFLAGVTDAGDHSASSGSQLARSVSLAITMMQKNLDDLGGNVDLSTAGAPFDADGFVDLSKSRGRRSCRR